MPEQLEAEAKTEGWMWPGRESGEGQTWQEEVGQGNAWAGKRKWVEIKPRGTLSPTGWALQANLESSIFIWQQWEFLALFLNVIIL